MGLFGNSAPASPGGLTRAQKWQLFGATLRDVGAGLGGEDGDAIEHQQASFLAQRKLAKAEADRAALYSGVFGSSAPARMPAAPQVNASSLAPASVTLDATGIDAALTPPAPRPMPSLRDVAPLLGRAMLAGTPGAKELVELLDKSGPSMKVANGVAYDERGIKPNDRVGVNLSPVNNTMVDTQDPGNADRYVPTEPAKGSRPVYDRYTGKQTGWEMMPGSAEAISTAAGAEAGGRAAATAGYEMVEIPLANGQKITMPKAQFLALSGGGGSPALPGLGVAQSPAEAEAAKLAATTAAERAAMTPKARGALDSQARVTDLVLDKIKEARGLISSGTTGLGSLAAAIPGTKARNLASIMDTIKANVGFGTLAEMRANSPTGGALGAISERENVLLQSVLGSMDQGISDEQLLANFDRIESELGAVRNERKATYDRMFAPVTAPTASVAPARATPAGGGRSAYSVVSVRRAGQ